MRFPYGAKENPGVITGTTTGRGRPGDYGNNISKQLVTMQSDSARQLYQVFSEPRIRPYRGHSADSDSRTFGTYAWNIALCESLYSVLNSLEITLRNSIQHAATQEFGDEFGFDGLGSKNAQYALGKARRDLKKAHEGESFSAADIIAQLNFGFWVGLFDSRYEQVLWRKLLKPVFPHIPRRHRTRGALAGRLYRIRLLRNRVFHHEPVWNRRNLNEQHKRIMETIGWINPEMKRFVEMLDRFPETYATGAGYLRAGTFMQSFKPDRKDNGQVGGLLW